MAILMAAAPSIWAATRDDAPPALTADPAGGSQGEVIYRQQLRVSADGSREVVAEGSNVVELEDGSTFTVTFDDLVDPMGRQYAIEGSVTQSAPEADVVYDLRVVEERPRELGEVDLLTAWRELHPEGSDEDLEAFQRRRASSPDLPADSIEVDGLLQAWLDAAADTDRATVWLKLTDQPALDLPQVGPGLADTDPVFVLDQLEDRLIAIEARKTAIAELQYDLEAELTERGARVTGRLWTMNAIQVDADAATIRALATLDRLARLELDGGDRNEATNRGEELRVATQIPQYLDMGFDGSLGSGRSAIDTIYVAVVDEKVDIDHPAWRDCSIITCDSRLVRQEKWNGSAWVEDLVGDTGGEQHGNRVAGQLLADLTDGQDLTIWNAAERAARTGMTTETSFIAIDKGSSGIDAGMERGVELNVDIMNLSSGCGDCTVCDLTHDRNDLANIAYHEGVFFTKGAGNDGHPTSECLMMPPGLGAGTFVVGGTDHTADDLNEAEIASFSSRGGDAMGRAVIDVTAPAGRSPNGVPEYDDSYTTIDIFGTSYAAPIAAGAAANLKHQLIDRWGATMANQVGFLHAMMLLMGDGQIESGVPVATTPLDDLWGAGRLRMRMWEPEGMDAPYSVFWAKRVLEDGETTSLLLNPDEARENQDIPNTVDAFKAVVWWYEPNVNYASGTPTELRTRVCDEDTSYCYTHSSGDPDAHRLNLGSVVADRTWRLDVTGLDIPSNLDPNDHYGQQKRDVFIAFYWEDRARDDVDGPDSGIQ
ncbi:S8/S53 family peptidase [Myxococcota bacterium]|nr:S8/S53 family peptidase [Myxococcota bacterium]